MKKRNSSLLGKTRIITQKDFTKLRNDFLWLWWLGMVIITAFIIVFPALGGGDSYEVGEICDNTIYYEGNTLSYMSDVKYEQAKKAIEEQVSPVYVLDE
ncbi:MAG: hypothetical protein Q4C00_06215, partial [Bacillota bacterium]|nr:hypothetical protein [Bacillota bacterium]